MSTFALIALLALPSAFGQASTGMATLPPCTKKQPGPPKNIKLVSTANVSPTASNLTISWENSNSNCISQWVVDTYKAGDKTVDKRISSVTVPASQSTVAGVGPGFYTYKTATPGVSYEFFIYGRNPSLGASGNGQGLRSAPLGPAAPVPVPAKCDAKQPGPPKNIRLVSAVNTGSTALMVFAWDHAGDKRCVRTWSVDIYPAGVKDASKRVYSAKVANPGLTTGGGGPWRGAVAGQKYELFVYGINPALGASGNGQGLRSAPFTAPVGISPL